MTILMTFGIIIAIVVMVVWPLMDGWFEDLESGDDNNITKWKD